MQFNFFHWKLTVCKVRQLPDCCFCKVFTCGTRFMGGGSYDCDKRKAWKAEKANKRAVKFLRRAREY